MKNFLKRMRFFLLAFCLFANQQTNSLDFLPLLQDMGHEVLYQAKNIANSVAVQLFCALCIYIITLKYLKWSHGNKESFLNGNNKAKIFSPIKGDSTYDRSAYVGKFPQEISDFIKHIKKPE